MNVHLIDKDASDGYMLAICQSYHVGQANCGELGYTVIMLANNDKRCSKLGNS